MKKHPPIEVEVTRTEKGDDVHYEAKIVFKSDLVIPKDAEVNNTLTQFEVIGQIGNQISTSILKFDSGYHNDKYTMRLNIQNPTAWTRFKNLFKRS